MVEAIGVRKRFGVNEVLRGIDFTVDAGQVICQIGVAPVKPAEFVVFQLSQFSGGTSLVSE